MPILLIGWLIPAAISAAQGIASNIIQGINVRKARQYGSEQEQVKRRLEAGLPIGTGNIVSGGTTVTPYNQGETAQDFISKSTTTSLQKKQLDLVNKELQIKDEELQRMRGENVNLFNPAGQFTQTNQGVGMWQAYQMQKLGMEAQQITNDFLPKEKGMSLFNIAANTSKTYKDIQVLDKTIERMNQEIKNLVTDGQIKSIVANYQDRMSSAELNNLIARTTGINTENKIRGIAFNVEWQTQMAKITIARNAALQSGETLKAAQLGNLLTNMSMPSTQAYYKVRYNVDQAALKKNNLIPDLIYLGMFQPNSSNYNLQSMGNLMPNFNYSTSKEIFLPSK